VSTPLGRGADHVAQFVRHLRQKGVRLAIDGDRLLYKAPKGALTGEDRERLCLQSVEILREVQGCNGDRCARSHDQSGAPLTFSQLAHWRYFQLGNRSAIRQIASATRLTGSLQVELLQDSLSRVLERHDALRTRIVMLDGAPSQIVDRHVDTQLSVIDLSALPVHEQEREILACIDRFILEPIDVATGPLLGAGLVRLSDENHVLIIVMEHMISDAYSSNLLLKELFSYYAASLARRPAFLAPIRVQFSDYASWQQTVERPFIERKARAWNERLGGCLLARLPEDVDRARAHTGWSRARIELKSGLREQLRERSRQRQTTIAMSAFVAYAALILRWTNRPESIVRYVSDGRTRPGLENTIGYFACPLYVPIRLSEQDTFIDLLARITHDYYQAHEHCDFSFLLSQYPDLEYASAASFNWVPQVSRETLPANAVTNGVACTPVRFVHPMLRNLHPLLKDREDGKDPTALLYDSGEEIDGEVYFPLHRFSAETMRRFATNFAAFLEALVNRPESRVFDVRIT
jgi:hypothetical protein